MQRLTIVKVWYQNDFGRFARRDERIARALLADPRVARVIHLEPPLPRDRAAGIERARPEGVRDAKQAELRLFTPTFERGTANPWREVLEQTARFLAANGAFDGPSLLWTSAPGALGDQLVSAIGTRFRWRVAEIEDDHRHWTAPRSEERLAIARRYERAARTSDLLLSNSQAMVDEFRRWQPNALRVANAVDFAPYEAWPVEPECLKGVPGPRLVYVGNLRLRLMPELFVAVADKFPQATLVLAGDDDGWLRAQLGKRSNVCFIGRVAPTEVPGLLVHANALLLPHVTGAITDAMDPQKLYEYLASGRPIVSTPVAGAREHGDVIALADDPRSFVAAVDTALRESDPAAVERRRAKVRGRTWEKAAASVLDAALAVTAPGTRLQAERELGYFQHDRPEVRRLVPESAKRILDVGCGAGALGSALKFGREPVAKNEDAVKVVGIELREKAAARAREALDEVRVGDAVAKLEELAGEGARFDAILFADLLEHLAEPELALAHAKTLLAPDGVLVASLPNVRHWSVLRQLLEGDFHYEPAGILDRTHLRFFTRRSAQRLFEEQGFAIERTQGSHWAEEGMPPKVGDALAKSGIKVGDLAQESREHQWLFVARARVAAPAGATETAAPVVHVAPAILSTLAPLATPATLADLPAVSIVIPVCNAADYTKGILDELRIRGGLDLEIVVVDNGSTDATTSVLAAHPEARVIRNAENKGFAGAVNQGLQAATAPIVCVLNNDTLLADGWLEPMTRLLATEPSIALVGPCTSYAKGAQQIDLTELAERANPAKPAKSSERRKLASLDEMRSLAAAWRERERGAIEDVSFLSGFCFTGRRDELSAIGLADAYGRGTFEDDELCRRLRRAGRRLVIARESYVHHFGNRTFQALGVDLAQQQEENWKRFAARHGEDAGIHARCAALKENWRDTLKLALAALKQSPTDLDALWLAALATARSGRVAEAAKLLDRYLARCAFDRVARELRNDCQVTTVVHADVKTGHLLRSQ